jgi:hypothetical protein
MKLFSVFSSVFLTSTKDNRGDSDCGERQKSDLALVALRIINSWNIELEYLIVIL